MPGDRMLANTRWSSSQTAVVPFGERFGVPSGQTVATKPRRCSSTTRFMSAVRSPVVLLLSCRPTFELSRAPQRHDRIRRARRIQLGVGRRCPCFRLRTDTHPASGSSRSRSPPHGSGRVPEPQTTSNVARPQDACQPRMIQWSARSPRSSRSARTERKVHLWEQIGI